MSTCIRACICICMCMCMHTHVYDDYVYISISMYIYIYIYTQVMPSGPQILASFFLVIFSPANSGFLGYLNLGPRSSSVVACWGVKLQVPGFQIGLHFACQRRFGIQHRHRKLANCSWTCFLEPTLPEPAHFSWLHVRTGHAYILQVF